MRSTIFNTCFYGFTALVAIVCIPLAYVKSRKPMVAVLHWWARGIVFLMRRIMGIRLEVRGKDHIPQQGPSLIASKHQSFGDGITVLSLIPDLAVVAMKDLMSYPLIGQILKKLEMIMVDMAGGDSEKSTLSTAARVAYDRDRPLLIYPEGQLVPVGTRERYKTGIYHLYKDLNLPVVPVASNLGLCWECRQWTKKPGTAVLQFMEPIATGLDQATFMRVLEDRIEAQTAQLVEQGS